MHSAGGPDEIPNGLALCSLHHKLFDLGVLTVNSKFKILVSEFVVGDWGRRLQDNLHGKPIALPRRDNEVPGEEFLGWHNRFVFKQTLERP